ncbi:hypothetical protein NDU88_001996 [Pleurodeles waltl]|uniref:Uncharacterized protein n=1 Tax=Pleurodeles waltl TaxID=8319 RepID=A0AAV7LB78_PLEWA|nr:hypothetical protein NDU88_001996 [Pleurodeles waltl]
MTTQRRAVTERPSRLEDCGARETALKLITVSGRSAAFGCEEGPRGDGRNRGPCPTQSHNTTKYAVPRKAATEVSSGRQPACLDPPLHTEPTVRDIMTAIQSVKDTLEPKVDTVTLEVNLIRADFKKVTEKLTDQISGLQSVM